MRQIAQTPSRPLHLRLVYRVPPASETHHVATLEPQWMECSWRFRLGTCLELLLPREGGRFAASSTQPPSVRVGSLESPYQTERQNERSRCPDFATLRLDARRPEIHPPLSGRAACLLERD